MIRKNVLLKSKKKKALDTFRQGRFPAAKPLFQELNIADPRDPDVLYCLGILSGQEGRLDESVNYLQQARELRPWHADTSFYLAKALTFSGRMDEAAAIYRTLISLVPRMAEARIAYGNLLLALKRYPEAEQCFGEMRDQGLELAAALSGLATVYRVQGDSERAIDCYRQALQRDSANLRAAIGVHLTLPVIYRNDAEMLAARRRYEAGLKELTRQADRFSGSPTLVDDLQWSSFYLAYQGLDDKELQVAYADFFTRLALSVLPAIPPPQTLHSAGGRRLRVGYVSHYFHDHTVGHYFNGWVMQTDKTRFETFVYHINPVQDPCSSKVSMHCDHYRPVSGAVGNIAGLIHADRLDVLVYPEIGMYSKHLWLAALRLAPVQCVAWGHPVTTGLSSIDYFLSAEATEPEGAETHYSEQLVRLPGMGFYYTPADENRRDRLATRLDLPEDRHLYLCPQSLFKIHLDTDRLFTGICRRDPKALILFFEDSRPHVTGLFKERLGAAFTQGGIVMSRYVRFLPRMPHADFLEINRRAVVMLDTPHWSGGKTSLDAISVGLPIVTLPGEFSRGRQTAGMLNELGLQDLIASSFEGYIETAVRLAGNPLPRAELSRKMLERAPGILFGNEKPVRALEAFFLEVTDQYT